MMILGGLGRGIAHTALSALLFFIIILFKSQIIFYKLDIFLNSFKVC